MSDRVLIRCDASHRIGSGHLMRCLALAEAWQRKGLEPVFVMAFPDQTQLARLSARGWSCREIDVESGSPDDSRQVQRIINELRPVWTILDGYQFAGDFQASLCEQAHLAVLDDNAHLARYCADVLINTNVHAADLSYETAASTTVLAGIKYALLRDEFLVAEPKQDHPTKAKRLLITFGGSDPCGLSHRALRALEKITHTELEVALVIGAAHNALPQLREIAAGLPHTVRVICNARNMAELMSWADLAISAAGSTTSELALMGLPSLLIAAADNQYLGAEEWQRLNAVEYLGRGAEVSIEQITAALSRLIGDSSRRQQLTNIGQSLVDGHGADRIVRFLIDRSACPKNHKTREHSMSKDNYDIVEDADWGYRRLEPIPATNDLNHFYESQYYDLLRKGGRAPELRRLTADEEEASGERKWLHKTLYGDIAHVLSESVPGGRVLDVGCGTGELLRFLAGKGFQVSGTEPSHDAATSAQEAGLDVHAMTLESFLAHHQENNCEPFDAVVLINVLEHVPDPANIVQICRSLLRPNGQLCIRVPNDFTEIQTAAANAEDIERWWIAVPDHINYFDFASLRGLLNQLDMEVTHEQGDFPMELFLLMGDNYVTTPDKGADCHERRVQLETSLPMDLRRRIYTALAQEGVGRNCLTFASRKAA